jgi:Tol biopolymer transport system component
MEADRWKKIQELYEAAIALPPEKRAEFLAQACPADAGLRGEVQSLLAQPAGSFLESAPVSAIKTLSPGVKLGNFEIVELIGRGGMGEVYRARDSRLKRDVAIKVLPAGLARDPDRIARFEREARAAGALNHPNIVAVYEIGREDGTYWIATELVAGEPLASAIEPGPLALQKALEIATQIAEGLTAAHAAGIVHRDLKPANIMVTRDGRVKILDFGLALRQRSSQDSTTMHITDEGTVLGTAGYMSPEQVRGETVDQRSDLFSFGVILYEMLGGKRAFAGASSVEVMNGILKEDPPELPATVPPAIDRIVRRCLQKDRERRFQTAADLGWALQTPSPSQPPAKATRRRTRLTRAAVVAAICAAIAIAAYLFEAHSRPSGIAAGTTLRRLTLDKGLTTDAAISADGKFVAYASDRADAGNLDIWVQQVAGGGAVRLTDNPADDDDPSISPDGSQVAFRSDRDGGGIYLVPVLGGGARLLIPKGNHPRFSPDGQMLMYSIGVMQESGNTGELFVQRLSGGAPTPIASECSVFPFSPVWSPDSRRIIFTADCKGKDGEGWVATTDGRFSPGALEEPVIDQWLTNPPRLLVPFDRSGIFDEGSIRTLPISEDGTKVTGPAERLTFGTGSERHASAGHGFVVVSAFTGEDHVWGIPIDAGGHSNGPPRQLTSGSTHEDLNYLSRDGRKLLFTSWRPELRLYLADLRTGKEQEVPTGDATGSWLYSVLSPDNTRLVFQSCCESASTSLYEGSVAGGFPKQILPGLWRVWDWSPNGRTLFSNSGPAVDEVDMNSLSKTTFLQDPEDGVWNAHFSPDGRWVTFNVTNKGNNTSHVYAVPFRKGLVPRSEWIPIANSGWDDKPHFSANGKLIVFSSDRDGFRCVWAQPLGPDMHPTGDAFAVYHSHERRRSLRNLDITTFDLAVGPDMVVFNQEERTGNIWVLEPAKKEAH